MVRKIVFLVLFAVLVSAIFAVAPKPKGVYVWSNQGASSQVCDTYIAVDDSGAAIESCLVVIRLCSDTTDTAETGYTDSLGWFAIDNADTGKYDTAESYVVRASKTGYTTKYARMFIHDTTNTNVVSIELFTAPVCTSCTLTAYCFDPRTRRPLQNVKAITKITNTPFFGDYGSHRYGAQITSNIETLSDSDGLIQIIVPKYALVSVKIAAIGYDESGIYAGSSKIIGNLGVPYGR